MLSTKHCRYSPSAIGHYGTPTTSQRVTYADGVRTHRMGNVAISRFKRWIDENRGERLLLPANAPQSPQ